MFRRQRLRPKGTCGSLPRAGSRAMNLLKYIACRTPTHRVVREAPANGSLLRERAGPAHGHTPARRRAGSRSISRSCRHSATSWSSCSDETPKLALPQLRPLLDRRFFAAACTPFGLTTLDRSVGSLDPSGRATLLATATRLFFCKNSPGISSQFVPFKLDEEAFVDELFCSRISVAPHWCMDRCVPRQPHPLGATAARLSVAAVQLPQPEASRVGHDKFGCWVPDFHVGAI